MKNRRERAVVTARQARDGMARLVAWLPMTSLPAARWPLASRRLAAAETLVAGMPYALRPLAAPTRRPALARWRPAAGPTAALLIGLAVLVMAFGVEVRRGIAEQAALRATLATTTVGAAAREAGLRDALAEAAVTSGRQREDLSRLAATVNARTLQADGLQRALAAERAALAEQRARAEGAEADAAEQRRQVEARQADRDALAEQLGQREAEQARLAEGFDALQGRMAAMEALTRKVRQTLGLPLATGPAGGDAPADGEGVALLERLAALDARSAVAGQALAVAERALRERLAALRQVTAAGQKVWLSPAAAAIAPTGWPASGPISSSFGPRISPIDEQIRFHPGVDIVVNVGTPVRATQAGQVVLAGSDGEYGLAVVIRHAGGFTTLYGHNSQILVRAGQTVERGQVVARSGNTGASTGPHIHYEVHYNGTAIDPAPFLKARS